MFRSLKVVGIALFTIAVPSLAFAGGAAVINNQQSGPTGPFETTVTVDTPPNSGKCPAVMTIHATTTWMVPDGKHFTAQAKFIFPTTNWQTTTTTLDFSKRTTVTWEAKFSGPDVGTVIKPGLVAVITDSSGQPVQEVVATQGSFALGCGSNVADTKPSIPSPTTLTRNICDDYVPANLSIKPPYVMFTGLGIASSMTHSMYSAKKQEDLEKAFSVIKHYGHMCSIPVSRFYWFEGEGEKNTPSWGTCNSYDNSVVTVTNDATGWLVKAGEKVLFRVGLEADARALGNAVKKRSYTCEIGEGTEGSEQVLHYLR